MFINTADKNSEEIMALILRGEDDRLKNIHPDTYGYAKNLNQKLLHAGFRYWMNMPEWVATNMIIKDLENAIEGKSQQPK